MTQPRNHHTDPDDLFAFTEGDGPPRNDLEATLRRVQRVTGGASDSAGGIPADLKTRVWEELMSAHTLSTAHRPLAGIADRAPRPSSLKSAATRQPRDRRSTRAAQFMARWQSGLSLAMVVAVLVGLVGISWYRSAGTDPDTPSYGHLAFQTNPEGTPQQLYEPDSVPTAAECTVEPLTVDEVMDKVFDPRSHTGSSDSNGTPTVFGESYDDVPSDTSIHGVPDQGTVDAIARSERQWVACHMAGDPFRYWVFEDRAYLQATMFGIYGPQLSMETLRRDLEALNRGDTTTPLEPAPVASDAFVPLVVTSGWDTFRVDATYGRISIPLYWISLDGTTSWIPAYTGYDVNGDPIAGLPSPRTALANRATFVSDTRTDTWGIESLEFFSGA
jgi:hypothetical protein